MHCSRDSAVRLEHLVWSQPKIHLLEPSFPFRLAIRSIDRSDTLSVSRLISYSDLYVFIIPIYILCLSGFLIKRRGLGSFALVHA